MSVGEADAEVDRGEIMTYISKDLSRGKDEVLKSNITEDQFNEIKDSLDYLDTCMYEIDYCLMLRDNIYDFLRNVENDKTDHDLVFVSLNRLFMNIMNSYYAWIEHHEKNYKSVFKPIASQYYDSHFEYRLAYNLRTYTTHHSLAITSTTTHLDSGLKTINIELEKLLDKKSGIQNSFRKELESIVSDNGIQTIDAYPFIITFFKIFEKLQGDIWNSIYKDIAAKIELLQDYTQNDRMIRDTYILTEDESDYLRIGAKIAIMLNKWKKIIVPDYLMNYLDS